MITKKSKTITVDVYMCDKCKTESKQLIKQKYTCVVCNEKLKEYTKTGRPVKRNCLKCKQLIHIIDLKIDGICTNCLKPVTKEQIIEQLKNNVRWRETEYGWYKDSHWPGDVYDVRFEKDKIYLKTTFRGSHYADRGYFEDEFEYTIGNCIKYLNIHI